MKRVILRADGHANTGFGHVFRLLALAQILKGHFECIFITNKPERFVIDAIEETCFSAVFLTNDEPVHLPDQSKPDDEIAFDLGEFLDGSEIVVTDGYLFGLHYQCAVKNSGATLVSIDDLAESHFYSDIVINHAPGVNKSAYRIQSYTRLLLGLDYAILRPPFFEPLKKKRNSLRAFISLGGSDFYGFSAVIADLLLKLNQYDEVHVLGSSSFSTQLIEKLNRLQSQSDRIKLHFNVDALQIVKILDSCSHAFVSASTVLLEAYSRGLKCFTGYFINNQKFIYDGFTQQGLAVGLGQFQELDFEKIQLGLNFQKDLRILEAPLNSAHRFRSLFHSL